MRTRPYCLHAVLLLVPSAATAPAQPADISADLEAIVAKRQVPGMVAAAMVKRELVAIGAAGLRERGKPERVTVDDLFHLGSCTKAMTATLAGVLVEQGSITWATTVGESFAALPMHEGWKPVTIEHLLMNRGGAPNTLDRDRLWARLGRATGSPADQRMVLVKGVLGWEPVHPAGQAFEYSNAGFSIAGAMLEHATDQSWEGLMQEKLFKPLGITSAGFGAPGTAESVDQPRGHRGGRAIPPGPEADNPAAISPAGRVHMTIRDWAVFAGEHASGEKGSALLKPETFKRLHEPPAGEDYAMGWIVANRPWAKGAGPEDTGRVLTHGGSNTMWHAVVWVAPERELAIVVATNQGDGEAPRATDDGAAMLVGRTLKK